MRRLGIVAVGLALVVGAALLSGALSFPPSSAQGGVTEAWVARYDGPAGGGDVPADLAVDESGFVYVTGSSWGGYSGSGGTEDDYATVKYDATGSEVWANRYAGMGFEGVDRASALALDDIGNVYVTGVSHGTGDTGDDFATIKYNSVGVEQWVARYTGPPPTKPSLESAFDLAVDGSGNVYVTGYSNGYGTGYDFATVKYSADGEQQWAARYNGGGQPYGDAAYGIALDESGFVYVAGASEGVGSRVDFATVKYSPEGIQ